MKRGFLMIFLFIIVSAMTMAGESDSIEVAGKSLFDKKCSNCHGKDGKGDTPLAKALRSKNLNVTEVILTKEKLAEWDTVTIQGKGKMPGYKKSLTPAEINAVLEYMSGFAQVPIDTAGVLKVDSLNSSAKNDSSQGGPPLKDESQ